MADVSRTPWPTELRLHTSDSDVTSFAQSEGYLQMYANRALILVEDAISPDDLDKSDLEDRLKTAERELEESEEGSEEERRAQRERRRWEAFISIADGA